MSKWDKRFFGLTNTLASWSEDESRKVGCVIVGQENGILSTGYNGLPRKVIDKVDRHDRKNAEKYYWFEHAERNAIYNAARTGAALSNSKMYVNLFPCADCTRGIIQSGISQLNTVKPDSSDLHFRHSFEVALEMLHEALVDVRVFDISCLTK